MTIEINVSDMAEQLDAIGIRATAALRPAAEAMGAQAQRAIEQMLSLSSHPRGTKTPSAPGSPPSLISGSLRRSVRQTMSSATAAGTWEVHVAPTIVYARIQELGGIAGKGHRSRLPPRPYVKPALVKSADAVRKAALSVYRKVLSG